MNQVSLTVKDYDLLSKDDPVGSTKFSLTDIKDKMYYKQPFWCHIYGAPAAANKDDIIKEMNMYSELGTRP